MYTASHASVRLIVSMDIGCCLVNSLATCPVSHDSSYHLHVHARGLLNRCCALACILWLYYLTGCNYAHDLPHDHGWFLQSMEGSVIIGQSNAWQRVGYVKLRQLWPLIAALHTYRASRCFLHLPRSVSGCNCLFYTFCYQSSNMSPSQRCINTATPLVLACFIVCDTHGCMHTRHVPTFSYMK